MPDAGPDNSATASRARTGPDAPPRRGSETPPRRGSETIYGGILFCFVLSGFAALLYQTAWLRQFSTVFGTSELAVATVLASYMAGLALGAALAGRFVTRVRRPVLVYGLLELGIAVSALGVPIALRLARGLQTAILGGQPELPDAGGAVNAAFYFVCAVVILAVPTAFMGATLPLLTRHAVRTSAQIGSRVGVLYAANTGGAVLGTVTAAFLILPALGLWGTLLVGAGVNAVVFVIATVISRRAAAVDDVEEEPTAATAGPTGTVRPVSRPGLLTSRVAWVLPLMLVSGAVSFTYEVLWTRLLGQILGGSIFAFATMLASFLTGITIGSAIASRFASSRDRAVLGLVIAQLGTAVLSIGIYYGLDELPRLAHTMQAGALGSPLRNLLVAAVVLLPATLCIGSTFPFAVRILARDERDAGPTSARVYAWNTAGAIAGAALAGFLLVPALRFEGTAYVAVIFNLALAVWASMLVSAPSWRFPVGAACVGAFVLSMFHPGMPSNILRSSPLPGHDARGSLVYYGVGRSATVYLTEHDGWFNLLSNGHPESGIRPKGSIRGLEVARWLAALPALARPESTSMLIVGFGGGTSISGAPPWIETVDCVEIEHEIIEANRAIANLRQDDPLRDERLRLSVNDARGALAVTTKTYDIIVSQPSHPWMAGASHLYTREFLREAKEHLAPDGVFVQWMNAAFVDESLMRVLGATMLDVFTHVRVYTPDDTMLTFIASDEPLDPEGELIADPGLIDRSPEHFLGLGIRSVEDVVVRLAFDEAGVRKLAKDATPNTDNHNRFATQAPRVLPQALWGRGVRALTVASDPLAASGRSVRTLDLDWVYVTGRLLSSGRGDRAMQLARTLDDPRQRLVAMAIVDRAQGRGQQARAGLLEALTLAPDDDEARFLLVETSLRALVLGEADPLVVREAAKLRGAEAAVVAGVRAEVTRDWVALQDLDEQLALARPTDVCFNHALRHRALWRTSLPPSMLTKPRADEAIALLDWYLAVDANWLVYAIRARAAVDGDRPSVLLETAGTLAGRFARIAAEAPAAQRQAIAGQARQLLGQIGPLSSDPRVSPTRYAEVARSLQRTIRIGGAGP